MMLDSGAFVILLAAVICAMTSGLGMKDVCREFLMGVNAKGIKIALVVDVSEVALRQEYMDVAAMSWEYVRHE